MQYFELMNDACKNINLEFNEEKYQKFIMYKELIQEWNKKVNLTAITEDEEIIKKHFIDCIKVFSFSPIKDAKNIIDVGTGAGFPGLPMKIIKDDVNMTLLDSLNKRVIFLNEVINNLKLNNISAYHGRAEEFGVKEAFREKYDVCVSRAVANLAALSEYCIPFVKVGGYFVAMKGPSVEQEVEEAKEPISILGGKIEDIIPIKIEDTDLKHNLVVIKKVKKTHKSLPRKSNLIGKKPLKRL